MAEQRRRKPEATSVGKRKHLNVNTSSTKKKLADSAQSGTVTNSMGSITYVPDSQKSYLCSPLARREINKELSCLYTDSSPLFPPSRMRLAKLGPVKRLNSKKRARSIMTRGAVQRVKKKDRSKVGKRGAYQEDDDSSGSESSEFPRQKKRLAKPDPRKNAGHEREKEKSDGSSKGNQPGSPVSDEVAEEDHKQSSRPFAPVAHADLKVEMRRPSTSDGRATGRPEPLPVVSSVHADAKALQRPNTVPQGTRRRQSVVRGVSTEKPKDCFQDFLETQNLTRLFKGKSKKKMLMESDDVVKCNVEDLRKNSHETKFTAKCLSPGREYENKLYHNSSTMKSFRPSVVAEKTCKASDALKKLHADILPYLDQSTITSWHILKQQTMTIVKIQELEEDKKADSEAFQAFLKTIKYHS